ncbi:MAG: ABC transporter ATP-binding protein [Bdellovibrionaceae bacterium]|nr:ABC transporter ATP-binding protein [Pseudobdellovibrionaceae bacterium]
MVLEVKHLRKTFRDPLTLKSRQVLYDVSFHVPEKTITAFLGGNGAGKTTTMKCILGLLKHESGDISFFDNKEEDFRKHIGYLPERPYFYEYLTGVEFLTFYGQLSMDVSKQKLKERVEFLLERVGLAHAGNKLLRSYSKGMLQRVGLAQAIIHDPRFLILDEPMSGLDPDGRHQVAELIRELGQKGTTIFFSSHLIDDIERLCNRLVVINTGKILYDGEIRDFIKADAKDFEVIYRKETQLLKEKASSITEVMNCLRKIEQEKGTLISVIEPRLGLEEAYNQFRQRAVP